MLERQVVTLGASANLPPLKYCEGIVRALSGGLHREPHRVGRGYALRNHDDWKGASPSRVRAELKRVDSDAKLEALFETQESSADTSDLDALLAFLDYPKDSGG